MVAATFFSPLAGLMRTTLEPSRSVTQSILSGPHIISQGAASSSVKTVASKLSATFTLSPGAASPIAGNPSNKIIIDNTSFFILIPL